MTPKDLNAQMLPFKDKKDDEKNKRFILNFRLSKEEKQQFDECVKYYNMKHIEWFKLMLKNTHEAIQIDKEYNK